MSKGFRVNWYGRAVNARVDAQVERNLDKASIMLESDIKTSFGNSGVLGKRGGASKADRRRNRSKPGEPPHVDTGLLKRSVGFVKPAPRKRWIGTGLGSKDKTGYAKFLEFGTRYMAPRPFLRPAFSRNRTRLARVLGAKIR